VTSALQNRSHRKVIQATDADLERLEALRAVVEHDLLFSRHPVHEAELIRAAVALAVAQLASEENSAALSNFLLQHIASEREQSQQLHAMKMQQAYRKPRGRQVRGLPTEEQ